MRRPANTSEHPPTIPGDAPPFTIFEIDSLALDGHTLLRVRGRQRFELRREPRMSAAAIGVLGGSGTSIV